MCSSRFMRVIGLIFLPLSLFANTSKNATVIGHWPEAPCRAVDVVGKYPHPTSGNALQILNISTPNPAFLVGQWQSKAAVNEVVLIRGYALVASEEEGPSIVDVSDTANPLHMHFPEQRRPGHPSRSVSRNYALVTDSRIGTVIIDVSDPLTP